VKEFEKFENEDDEDDGENGQKTPLPVYPCHVAQSFT
jgi:hypothetical protein